MNAGLFPFLLLLPLLIQPLPSHGNEPHAPIRISGDLDLVGPDAARGNGVRGGAGTAADPWRISGWVILAPTGESAVVIRGVKGHLLLEDLVLRVSGEGAHAIVIVGSDHVRVERVRVEGAGAFLLAERSSVSVADSDALSDEDGDCLRAHGSVLLVRDVRFGDGCGVVLGAFSASEVEVRDVVHEGRANGFVVVGPADRVSFRNVSLAFSGGPTTLPGTTRALGARGVLVEGDVAAFLGDRVALRGFRDACLEARATPGGAPRDVRLHDVRAEGCGEAGLRLEGLGAAPVHATGLHARESGRGVALHSSRLEATRVLLQGNAVGLDVAGAPPADARLAEATLLENEVHVRATPPARAALERAWWDGACAPDANCARFEGAVESLDRLEAPPVPWPEGARAARATPAAPPFVAFAVAALLARAWRCRT